jgi:hypothetical protein
MVNAISFLWSKGWHAPAGRPDLRTPASSQARQISPAAPVGATKTWDPADRSFRRTARAASADPEVRPGPRAPDPTPPPGHRRGSRARSTAHTLPADSERPTSVSAARVPTCRTSNSGHAVRPAVRSTDVSLLPGPNRDSFAIGVGEDVLGVSDERDEPPAGPPRPRPVAAVGTELRDTRRRCCPLVGGTGHAWRGSFPRMIRLASRACASLASRNRGRPRDMEAEPSLADDVGKSQ